MPDENNGAEPEVGDQAEKAANTEPGAGEHAAPDGAPLHPLIDLSRDPTPGKPDHALPEDE
jgi:hypothetical protein